MTEPPRSQQCGSVTVLASVFHFGSKMRFERLTPRSSDVVIETATRANARSSFSARSPNVNGSRRPTLYMSPLEILVSGALCRHGVGACAVPRPLPHRLNSELSVRPLSSPGVPWC